MRCLYEKGRCVHCGNADLSKGESCSFQFVAGESPVALIKDPASTCRAGAALHELLAGPPFFFASGGDCGCESFAAQMDAWGCDEVIRRIDQVVAHLEQQAARRGLPFHRVAGRILVRRAVRNARRAEQRERHDG